MILESVIARQMLQRETERFSETKASSIEWWIAAAYLISIIIYVLALIILWLRVVTKAFGCSTRDGVMSVLTPSLYGLFVFGNTITLTCAKV